MCNIDQPIPRMTNTESSPIKIRISNSRICDAQNATDGE